MRIAGVIALAAAVLGAGRAQTAGAAAIQSSSGQFVVFAVQSSVPLSRPGRFAADTNLISLEPALLAVSSTLVLGAWTSAAATVPGREAARLPADAPSRGRGAYHRAYVRRYFDHQGFDCRLGDYGARDH